VGTDASRSSEGSEPGGGIRSSNNNKAAAACPFPTPISFSQSFAADSANAALSKQLARETGASAGALSRKNTCNAARKLLAVLVGKYHPFTVSEHCPACPAELVRGWSAVALVRVSNNMLKYCPTPTTPTLPTTPQPATQQAKGVRIQDPEVERVEL